MPNGGKKPSRPKASGGKRKATVAKTKPRKRHGLSLGHKPEGQVDVTQGLRNRGAGKKPIKITKTKVVGSKGGRLKYAEGSKDTHYYVGQDGDAYFVRGGQMKSRTQLRNEAKKKRVPAKPKPKAKMGPKPKGRPSVVSKRKKATTKPKQGLSRAKKKR